MDKQLDKAIELFRKVIDSENKFIQIVSHYDADGLSSAAIFLDAIKDICNHSLTIVKQVKQETIDRINSSNADLVVFTDLGSELYEKINKPVIILDHHNPSKINDKSVLVNPCVFDENSQTSGSIITYLFCKRLDEKNKKNAFLGVVGAKGDMQEFDEGINKQVLDEAVELKQITIEKDINFFGRTSRPIHKALEYSTDPFIPGISGNESGAVQFLSTIGIPMKRKDEFLTLRDLTEEEKKKLASSIIIERLKYDFVENENIFKNHYYIDQRKMDANEFSTNLNAFGRLEKYPEGVLYCLDYDIDSEDILAEYRKKIATYIIWINENPDKIIKQDKIAIIDANDEINENFIGTVSTISINSGIIQKPLIVGMANAEDGIKISARTVLDDLNVQKLLEEIVSEIGGETGGHPEAAGAKIEKAQKDNFINIIINKIRDKN